jgi:hypothetical protein
MIADLSLGSRRFGDCFGLQIWPVRPAEEKMMI